MEKENNNKGNIDKIVKENNLRIIKKGFFRDKQGVAKVENSAGEKFILKTERIDPLQMELMRKAKEMEDDLVFKVPAMARQAESWYLMEEIVGQSLNEFYDSKPEWCVKISKKIADDYQKVIDAMLKENKRNLLPEGEKWLFERLDLWSEPIVSAGLIKSEVISEVKDDFQKIVREKGEQFFGWMHGNIIGDHIIVSGDDLYLLDLAMNARVGRGYYDFLRALDFMFLKTENEQEIFAKIPRWFDEYLSEFNHEEVKLVFAFRAIGLLGWDILHHNEGCDRGDLERKKEMLIKFIKRR